MPWDKKYHSDKNGEITVYQGLGGVQVLVGGYSQTSEGLNAIWRDAFHRAESFVTDRPSVLVLGLGGGGILREIYDIWPSAKITAVEYDPEMIAITHELKFYGEFPLPEIICADAGEAVPALKEKFDIIAVDIFKGGKPSDLLMQEEFLNTLKKTLSKKGVLLVNVADSREYLDPVAKHFSHADMWLSAFNYVGMFAN
ncbi:MAG: putative spermine/spermidine synthase protein spermidine synthase [Candidatus Kaiserbacteria bacterium]|nr:putative spermine/spermidine synthase protein spermidine synthase [Candidatus Kaiserbacteria bacterium]